MDLGEMQDALFSEPEKKSGTEIEQAVTDMFLDLEEKDLLSPVERAKRAMLLKTAKALDVGLAQSKVSVATANLFTKTMEALETLPRAVTANDSMDAWDAAILDETAAAMAAESNADDDLIPVDEWTTP